jgi:hypothetical protein
VAIREFDFIVDMYHLHGNLISMDDEDKLAMGPLDHIEVLAYHIIIN